MDKIFNLSNDAMFKMLFNNKNILAKFMNVMNLKFELFDWDVEAKYIIEDGMIYYHCNLVSSSLDKGVDYGKSKLTSIFFWLRW